MSKENSETNTNTIDYYVYYILSLAIFYALIMVIMAILKNRNDDKNKVNVTFDYYGKKAGEQIIHDVLTVEQSSLRWRFLLASTFVKAATWVKAPYLFALYNRVHGFTRGDIGVLYAIDNLSSLLFGPIIGSLCDMYGRKKFCVAYCFAVVLHICLRLTGSQHLAYGAQIITGICSVLVDTVFESWLNFEASFLFDNSDNGKRMKNSYLRELFTKQVNLDCFTSIVLTGVATVLYLKFNIYYPFYACIVLALIAAVIIMVYWKENDVVAMRLMDKDKE